MEYVSDEERKFVERGEELLGRPYTEKEKEGCIMLFRNGLPLRRKPLKKAIDESSE
jgi:hypothetical protein